jgi:hypothetical protein
MDTSREKNRPGMRDLIPKGVMFHETGSTGWGCKRDLGGMREDVLLASASPDALQTARQVKGAGFDGDTGRDDAPGQQRHAVSTKEEGAEGLATQHVAGANLEGCVHRLPRERTGDERDVARLVPGRANPERRRRQDVDFMGPARALRAGRGLGKQG